MGEIGERIAIGELAKYNIDIAIPLSDNYPYDFIAIYKNKFYKCQVKSSNRKTKYNSIEFSLKKNNWYNKSIKKYTKDDADIFILCDFKTIYLLTPDEFENKVSFTIYNGDNDNIKRKHAKDYIISQARIDVVFT